MANVGALIVDLEANTAAFIRDMGKARNSLEASTARMNKAVASVSRGIRAFAGLLGTAVTAGALASFAKSTIDSADKLDEMSQKVNVAASKLSAYEYAAKMSGSSIDALSTSLVKLSKNMSEAAANPQSQMARQFKALNIEVRNADGTLRNVSSVFEELSARFAGTADSTEKTSVAVALLGRSGAELIPTMNTLKETTAEAQRLGFVVSDDFAKQAAQFNDSIDRMKSGFGTFSRAVLANVIPAINEYIERVNVAIGAQDRLSLQTLERQRRRAADEYLYWKERSQNMPWDPSVQQNMQQTLSTIDSLDAQIIDLNKSMLALQNTQKNGPKLTVVGNTQNPAQVKAVVDEHVRMAEALKLQIDPMYRLNQEYALYDALLAKGLITQEQWTAASEASWNRVKDAIQGTKEEIQKIQTETQRLAEDWANTTKQMDSAVAGWARSTADAITDLLMGASVSFKEFANAIIRDLIRIQVQKAIAGMFSGFTGGTGGVEMRAAGGPVSQGSPYIVGERGPELFVPKQSGQIVPNNELGGTSVVVNQSFDFRGADGTTEARLRMYAEKIKQESVQAVFARIERGGAAAAAVGRRG